MCFHKLKSHDKGKIATRNITCYKYMNIERKDDAIVIIAPHQRVFYQKDKIYSIKKTFARHESSVGAGFHSKIKLEEAKDCSDTYENRVVVKCIIPKGSYYLKNHFEYVSNALKIVEILEKSKKGILVSTRLSSLNKKWAKYKD